MERVVLSASLAQGIQQTIDEVRHFKKLKAARRIEHSIRPIPVANNPYHPGASHAQENNLSSGPTSGLLDDFNHGLAVDGPGRPAPPWT